MLRVRQESVFGAERNTQLRAASRATVGAAAALLLLLVTWSSPVCAEKKSKKDKAAPAPKVVRQLDWSDIVFPDPPAPTRLKYLDFFSADKDTHVPEQKKTSWMDRMAGVDPNAKKTVSSKHFQLLQPYGMATDSKGLLYVADTKVGAVFIFNIETRDTQLIKNGSDAKFGSIYGLAIDDDDRLFVSDAYLRHILMFTPDHKLAARFGDGLLMDPCGMAIDSENRFLYVADTGLDQVLVFDVDTLRLLRRIGVAGKNHTSSELGEFSKPTNVAVDEDGNLYVSDTMNNRIEVFDADGQFIRAFGRYGDGPGYFARPKGIAIDSDGHVWVADGMQNRIQVFTAEGKLLLPIGGFGRLPGQFQALSGIMIDKKQNRVFTSEYYMARVQMFRYFTNAEAGAQFERLKKELAKQPQPVSIGAEPAKGAAETKPGDNSAGADAPVAAPAVKGKLVPPEAAAQKQASSADSPAK